MWPDIMYTTQGFVRKNRDTLFHTLQNCMAKSRLTELAELYGSLIESDGGKRSSSLQVTVAKRFRAQLRSLIQTMNATTPRFVRCIKSNADKVADRFHSPMVLRQLKYAGVMEALRVRRAGFPNRLAFLDFLKSYSSLIKNYEDTRAIRSGTRPGPDEEKRIVKAIFNNSDGL